MGLLNWLTEPAHQTGIASPYAGPSHLEQITLAHLLELDQDLTPVTRAQAMRIPAVARGRKTLATTVGRTLWEARTAAGRASDQPVILTQPEAGRPRALTFTWITDALIFHGRAWLTAAGRTYTGRPYQFHWHPEETVSWVDGEFRARGVPYPISDVYRIDGPDEGLLNYGQDVLRAARAISRAYGRTAANPTPAIELHQTQGDKLSETEIDNLIGRWIKARTSPNGAVGFTNQAIELKTHGMPVEQLLIAGRKAVNLEVAQALGLPAWAVDAEVSGSSITYSNSPSRTRELLDYSLAGYFEAIAGRLSMDDILPRGTWAHPLTNALTTPDFKDRMDGYKAAQDANIYTAEECKALETGTPLEGTNA